MFWNPVTNVTSCNPCPPNCASCDGTGVCTSCIANYTVAPNQCIQCPYNCSVCLNSTICYNNCTKNYLWNSVTGKCLPNGAERIFLAGIALLSVFLYFLWDIISLDFVWYIVTQIYFFIHSHKDFCLINSKNYFLLT